MLDDHATEDVEYFAELMAKKVQVEQVRTESAVHSLGTIVAAEFDLARAKEDPTYIAEHLDTLRPAIKAVGQQTPGTIGVYVYFRNDKFEGFHYAWYAFAHGEFVDELDTEADDPNYLNLSDPNYYDNPDYVWYFDPIRTGEGVWTNVYIDTDLHLAMYSYVEPIYVDGEMIAVVGMDRGFDQIAQEVQDRRLGNGYAFMLDRSGNYIVPPMQDVDEGFKGYHVQMTQRQGAIVGEKYLWGYTHLDNDYTIVTVTPKEEALAFITEVRSEFLMVSILLTLVMIIVGIILADGLTKDT